MASRRDQDMIDIKLDKRQVSVLVVAALAVSAMVFFLGVVVGRRMAGEIPTKDAEAGAVEAGQEGKKDRLAVLDAQAESEKAAHAPGKVGAGEPGNKDDAKVAPPEENTRAGAGEPAGEGAPGDQARQNLTEGKKKSEGEIRRCLR